MRLFSEVIASFFLAFIPATLISSPLFAISTTCSTTEQSILKAEEEALQSIAEGLCGVNGCDPEVMRPLVREMLEQQLPQSGDPAALLFSDKCKRACPPGTSECSAGGSSACCTAGENCIKASGEAWCSPKDQSSCPSDRPKLCAHANGKDNACCRNDEVCTEFHGSMTCGSSEDACKKSGGVACGDSFCCRAPRDRCNGYGLCSTNSDKCKAKGLELCEGSYADICCAPGTCRSGTIPSCDPTPTPTPSPTPSQSPSPSPSPSRTPNPAQTRAPVGSISAGQLAES